MSLGSAESSKWEKVNPARQEEHAIELTFIDVLAEKVEGHFDEAGLGFRGDMLEVQRPGTAAEPSDKVHHDELSLSVAK